MHLIVYTSVYSGLSENLNRDVYAILTVSRRNNFSAGITGVIFCHDGRFLQFLEGEEKSLRQLMDRVTADERHTEIRSLFDEPIQSRGFADWSMDYFDVTRDEAISLSCLERIRDVYRSNFVARTNTLVGIYKGFIEQGFPQ